MTDTKCIVRDCNQLQFCKQWCYKHYWRNRRYGDPEFPMAYRRERVCRKCGGRTPHGNRVFCSDSCRYSAPGSAQERFISRLTENSTLKSSYARDGLIKYGLRDARCEGCGLEEWTSSFGTSAPLQLDHINGVRTDNRIENLRILCANCHTQTDTFCGRNKGNKPR